MDAHTALHQGLWDSFNHKGTERVVSACILGQHPASCRSPWQMDSIPWALVCKPQDQGCASMSTGMSRGWGVTVM